MFEEILREESLLETEESYKYKIEKGFMVEETTSNEFPPEIFFS